MNKTCRNNNYSQHATYIRYSAAKRKKIATKKILWQQKNSKKEPEQQSSPRSIIFDTIKHNAIDHYFHYLRDVVRNCHVHASQASPQKKKNTPTALPGTFVMTPASCCQGDIATISINSILRPCADCSYLTSISISLPRLRPQSKPSMAVGYRKKIAAALPLKRRQ